MRAVLLTLLLGGCAPLVVPVPVATEIVVYRDLSVMTPCAADNAPKGLHAPQ